MYDMHLLGGCHTLEATKKALSHLGDDISPQKKQLLTRVHIQVTMISL